MDPDASKLLRLPAEVHLIFEELGDGHIIERDERLGAVLLDKHEIRHTQQIIRFRDAKPTDLGRAEITQK
jgi:hypothetical protein